MGPSRPPTSHSQTHPSHSQEYPLSSPDPYSPSQNDLSAHCQSYPGLMTVRRGSDQSVRRVRRDPLVRWDQSVRRDLTHLLTRHQEQQSLGWKALSRYSNLVVAAMVRLEPLKTVIHKFSADYAYL